MKYNYNIRMITFLTLISFNFTIAQTFTKITDSSNPITSTNYPASYTGAAWVDIDNDGDIDLHTSGGYLFRNDGNGTFVQLETQLEANQTMLLGTGVSWADYDNDGDIDCAIAGNPSTLFRNKGDGTFEPFEAKDLITTADVRGWSCAWGDYNNDSYVDLVVAHPAGFIGVSTPSFLFDGGPGGALTLNNSFELSKVNAPYTVSIWSDFDLDNDYDLFIGSGPAGVAARDYNFINQLTETGVADLDRMNDLPMGSDLQDGQVWNWIDYDNDGDLDAYLTNYGGAPNRFYINNDGVFESVTNELTFGGAYLANSWGDIDNDGDLDVFITGDTNNKFFLNNGDGTFTEVGGVINTSAGSVGATLGDYDDDGDLDIFISGQVSGLYRNDNSNSNNWLNVSLKGSVSNKSAIGAKVRAKANINGKDIWQIREVSSQNSFNSHNSLRQHFGFGTATVADSLIVYWPSGRIDVYTEVALDQFVTYEEELPVDYLRTNFSVDSSLAFAKNSLAVQFTHKSISHPSNPVTSWKWDFNNDGTIDSEEQYPSFNYEGKGKYSVSLTVANSAGEHKIVANDLINITGFLPSISLSATTRALGSINADGGIVADTFYVYNEGMGTDSIYMDVEYFLITSNDGISFVDDRFEIQPKDSHEVIVLIDPEKIEPKDRLLLARTVARSVFSSGTNEFKTNYSLRIRSVTSVEETEEIPIHFNLAQNYPNPFNPSTIIKFAITEQAFTTLKVYDLLGSEVASLIGGNLTKGTYEVNFNAGHLASGNYIYQLRSGNNVQTKKLLLIK